MWKNENLQNLTLNSDKYKLLESRRLREAKHEFTRNAQIEAINQTHQNTVRNLNQSSGVLI